jgi:hypothetical protein
MFYSKFSPLGLLLLLSSLLQVINATDDGDLAMQVVRNDRKNEELWFNDVQVVNNKVSVRRSQIKWMEVDDGVFGQTKPGTSESPSKVGADRANIRRDNR